MDPVKHEKSCGAIVFRAGAAGPEALLIKHVNGGHWAFPKGHVEGTETEEETALREIREETGLTVRLDTGFRKSVSYSPAAGVVKEVVYFLAYADGEQPVAQEREVTELCFLPVEEALIRVTYKNDRKVLEAAAAFVLKKKWIDKPRDTVL